MCLNVGLGFVQAIHAAPDGTGMIEQFARERDGFGRITTGSNGQETDSLLPRTRNVKQWRLIRHSLWISALFAAFSFFYLDFIFGHSQERDASTLALLHIKAFGLIWLPYFLWISGVMARLNDALDVPKYYPNREYEQLDKLVAFENWSRHWMPECTLIAAALSICLSKIVLPVSLISVPSLVLVIIAWGTGFPVGSLAARVSFGSLKKKIESSVDLVLWRQLHDLSPRKKDRIQPDW